MRGAKTTVRVGEGVTICTDEIPGYVGRNLGQAAFEAIRKAYDDPVIQADYQRWKQERERKGK